MRVTYTWATRIRTGLLSSVALALLAGRAGPSQTTTAPSSQPSTGQSTRDCEAIASKTGWPAAGTRIVAARWRASGPPQQIPFGPPITLPEHCEVTGVVQERTGVDGQRYAIRFHLRLASNWNGRFLFEGG